MRLSVVQMNPGSDKAANIAEARALVARAVAADAPGFVTLPEIWTYLGGDREGRMRAAEALPAPGGEGGEAYEALRGMARAHGVFVQGGSLVAREGERLRNVALLFDPEGRELARYAKAHLFDAAGAEGRGFRESAAYDAGEAVAVVAEAGGLRVGLSVCYDLRFPLLYDALRRAGAELVCVPSSFTVATGRDHWEVLLRARAIETQCYVAAAATWGAHMEPRGPRETYGHSLVCDPWGRVLARLDEGTGWATAEIDPAPLARVRADMPVAAHRRAFP